MEEQKNTTNSVEEVVKGKKEVSKETKKPTYEELDRVCGQLYMQVQELQKKLATVQGITTFKRVEYLFKVIEISNQNSTYTFTSDFVQNCITELENALTPSEEGDKEISKEAVANKG